MTILIILGYSRIRGLKEGNDLFCQIYAIPEDPHSAKHNSHSLETYGILKKSHSAKGYRMKLIIQTTVGIIF